MGDTKEKVEVTDLTEDIVEDIKIETIKAADDAGEGVAGKNKGENKDETDEKKSVKKEKRKISLQVKINVFLTVVLLVVTMQLLNINYHSYKKETKERIDEKLDAAEGDKVTFDKVLYVNGQAGAPYVKGATVTAKVEKQGRGKKIIVFKYKPKKKEHNKKGHRQSYTKLTVEAINA